VQPTRRAILAALAAHARPGPIQLGVCEPTASFASAVGFGFDYFDAEAVEIAAMSDTQFAAFKQQVDASPIRCHAFRSFIRRGVLVGPNPSQDLEPYLKTTTARCAALGAKVIVFGSGGARNVPEGFSRTKAWDQLCAFLRKAGDIAKPHGITIAIEHLRRAETNIVNTVAEAAQLAADTAHSNVRIVVDYYHLRHENDTPDALYKAQKLIVHLHIANPAGRVWPTRADNDPLYKRFFQVVREIGYRGGISIEAPNGKMVNDAPEALRFFAEMLA
jgi:sugar phosphate isomerase/epimerase